MRLSAPFFSSSPLIFRFHNTPISTEHLKMSRIKDETSSCSCDLLPPPRLSFSSLVKLLQWNFFLNISGPVRDFFVPVCVDDLSPFNFDDSPPVSSREVPFLTRDIPHIATSFLLQNGPRTSPKGERDGRGKKPRMRPSKWLGLAGVPVCSWSDRGATTRPQERKEGEGEQLWNRHGS